MTPQSTFMITAPVADGKLEELRSLLVTMNSKPGLADPDNTLVRFPVQSLACRPVCDSGKQYGGKYRSLWD